MAVDKPDRNYDVRNLNKVFAIGSIVLTITVLLMVIDDYVRVPTRRVAVKAVLYTLSFGLFAFGTLTIFTFSS